MQNSKLIKLLKTLSTKELNQFKKYIRSPYFNENQKLIRLTDHILRYAPIYRHKALNKETVFNQFFPGKSYDDLVIRHLISEILHLLNGFLKISGFRNNEASQQIQLLQEYRRRGLTKNFEKTYNKSKSLQTIQPYRDANFYFQQHHLETEYATYSAQQQKRLNEHNIQLAVESLDIYYLIKKLKYCCEILNFRNVTAFEYDILLMDEILSHLEKNIYEFIPAIAIYYQILMTLMDHEQEEHFDKLKMLLERNADKFPREEAFEMYTYAQNYCIKKINAGKSRFLDEIFSLYKSALAKELMLDNRQLSPWHYKNIVTTGLKLNEFDWVFDFIHDYQALIPVTHRENAFIYNRARYHFYRREYDKVLPLLQQVEFDDLYYNLDARTMLLKIYYEREEVELLYSMIDSFGIYLKRNKLISDYHRKNYLNFVYFTRKIFQLSPGEAVKADHLKEELSAIQHVTEKTWLEEQLTRQSA